MARLTYGMIVSLDGYVSGPPKGPSLPIPAADLHQYFNDQMRRITLEIYGRRMYEAMRPWGDDSFLSNAPPVAHDFAHAWRAVPKIVVSTTLTDVGPNCTLVKDDIVATVRKLKAEMDGLMTVSGPTIAAHMTRAGLIDEYELYYAPVALGGGKRFFHDTAINSMSLVGVEKLPQDFVLMRYAPKVA